MRASNRSDARYPGSEGSMDDVVKMFKESLFDMDAVEAVILTNDLRIVWMSPGLEREFGPLKDFVGKTCYEAFTGEPEPHVNCTVRKTIETRAVERSVNSSRTYLSVGIPLGEDHVAELIVKMPEEEKKDD
jgi:hypothetical protein